MDITIRNSDDHAKGSHRAYVTIRVSDSKSDSADLAAANKLSVHFQEVLSKMNGLSYEVADWGSNGYDNNYEVCVYFSRNTRIKKDHIPSEQILGLLYKTYGDLEGFVRKAIEEIKVKILLLERAKKAISEANHYGEQISFGVRKQAKKNIGYEEKLAKLNEELNSEINILFPQALEECNWNYSNTDRLVDPVARQLIVSGKEHFINSACKGSSFFRSVVNLYNEYAAPWLAAVLEDRDDT